MAVAVSTPSRRALLGGMAALATLPGVALAAPNPDAGIPDLVRRHQVNYDRYNSQDGADERREEVLFAAYLETLDQVTNCEPATLAGLFAKAQVARFEDEDDTLHRSLVDDLLRLAGGAA